MHIQLLCFLSFIEAANGLRGSLYPFANESVGSPVVLTTSGQFTGFTIRQTNVWVGIPYAAAPIGSLRWEKARPYVPTADQNTTGQNATQYGPSCPQIDYDGSTPGPYDEDCLFLNIWAPRMPPANGTKYPVMIWIHGGGLQLGSGTQITFDGLSWTNAAIQSNQSFILVTINYRLNVFGFFSQSNLTDSNGHMIGNQGINDQRTALKWVRDNIGNFGGDKNYITIAGQSAGSISVCIHLVSSLSAGLFHAAILESGGCDFPYFMYEQQFAYTATNNIAPLVGCNMTDSGQQLSCLRAVNTSALLQAMTLTPVPPAMPSFLADFLLIAKTAAFGLIWDGIEVDIYPLQAFMSGTYQHVPTLLGATHDEYALRFLYEGYSIPPISAADYVNRVLPAAVFNQSGINNIYTLEQYGGDYTGAFIALMSQLVFHCGAHRMAGFMSAQPTYLYTYNHAPEYPLLTLPSLIVRPGAYHSSEFFNTFQTLAPNLYGDQIFMPDEISLARSVRQYWTNMITRHQPNDPTTINWPQYSSNNDQVLVLDVNITAAPYLSLFPNCSSLSALHLKFFQQYLGMIQNSTSTTPANNMGYSPTLSPPHILLSLHALFFVFFLLA